MNLSPGRLFAVSFSLVVGASSLAPAQERSRTDRQEASRPSTAPTAPAATGSSEQLTGKERLGKKWTDEQRVDNCNVPVDKRGPRPRPNTCPNIPTQ